MAGKVRKWVEDVDELAKIAKDDPQAVFTRAISHRWTHDQRTIPDIENMFAPLGMQ